jgi:diguanylate cyclase (GGDEF)-like protein
MRRSRTADRSRGTLVALGFSGIAAALATQSLLTQGWPAAISSHELVALLVAAALAEQVTITIGERTSYSFSTPIIVLTGLVGGPIPGLLAGLVSGGGGLRSAWRYRLTYAGLCGMQGFVAGVIGSFGISGAAASATAAAFAALLAISVAGRALIYVERQTIDIGVELVRGTGAEVVEAIVAVPLVALLVLTFPQEPLLVLAVVGSVLSGLVLLQLMRRHHALALSRALGSALTDALTGAPNRLAFENALESEHARVLRGARPGGLFLLDLDHFKTVNDRFGHQVGDAVLVEVVRRLNAAVRRVDVMCRWGGEELAVLAPDASSESELAVFGERLRQVICAEPITVGFRSIDVTISVGAAALDGSAEPHEVVARADRALYRAKRLRNTVVVEPAPRSRRLALVTT